MDAQDQAELKEIWAYMVIEGTITDGTYSYFGGGFNGPYQFKSKEMDKFRDRTLIPLINEFGVAWGASGLPAFMSYSQFVGTDSPSEYRDCLIGTLVLTNGSTYILGVRDADTKYIDLVDRQTKKLEQPSTDYTSLVFGKN